MVIVAAGALGVFLPWLAIISSYEIDKFEINTFFHLFRVNIVYLLGPKNEASFGLFNADD